MDGPGAPKATVTVEARILHLGSTGCVKFQPR